MKALLAVLVAGIVHLSLYPWRFVSRGIFTGLRWYPLDTQGDWMDAIVNVVVYVPLGLVGVLAFPSRPVWNAAVVCCTGFVLSLGIEWLQFYIPGRNSNLRDVAANALGAAIGAAAGVLVIRLDLRRRVSIAGVVRDQDWILRLLLIGAWVVWQFFPFLPSLRRATLSNAVRQLLHPRLQVLDFGDHLFAFVLLWMLLGGLFRNETHRRLVSIALWLMLPMRALVVDQTLSFSGILGGATGLIVALLLLPNPRRGHVAMSAIAFVVWLGFRELMPFNLHSQAGPFYWIPFSGITSADWDGYARILSGKFLLYTGTLWMLEQSAVPPALATLGVAALLATGESVQRYLPGRTPETTDVALALLGAVVLAAGRARR